MELNILNRKIIKNFAITFLIVIKIYINNFLYSKKNHQFLKNVDKIKEGNFLDFFNSTIKNNTILIFEPNIYHQECIPGFSKYFIDLGYNVDILMHELGNNCFTLFPETKSIRLRTFNNLIEIQSKAHDFSKIIKKYELILLQSSYEPNMLLYSELDVLNKNNSIFVVHDLNTVNKDFSQYFAQNRVITLGNFSKGLQVNPHYFGDIKIKDKNKKIRFFLTFTYQRNYTIFSETVERLKSENFNFEIIIFGRTINFTSSYFPQNLNNNLKVKFRASYSEFYEAVESSDYIIVTLDPKNENDIPYKTTKVTGNIQLMYGFLKPIIINKEFAQFYDLNINNSLISNPSIYYFQYKRKPHEMRLRIIREEVLNNIPKYNISPDDLYINIRSGDIFVNAINSDYSQPPLCFYQKIINEKNYKNNYIVSNGHENPVVDKLLKLFPEIKYVHDSVEGDISIIVNAYNLIMPVSTFPWTLIRLNFNLVNLYIYELINYDLSKINSTIHIMKPSPYYENIMKRKWQKTEKQLELMINENCTDINFTTIFPKKNSI